MEDMHRKPHGPRLPSSLSALLALTLSALLGPLASAAQASPDSRAVATDDGEEAEARKDPMGWFGIGIKVGLGVAGRSQAAFVTPLVIQGVAVATTVQTSIERRSGGQLSVPINFGGNGFGWVLEPYLNMHTITFRPLTLTALGSSVSEGNALALGVYTGPTITFQVARPFYLGLGFGLKAAHIRAEHLKQGVDLGGRVPLTATIYPAQNFGIVAEVGLGYTATGYMKKAAPGERTTGIAFGSAFAWDFSAGVRWP
jgi:hypothetical protein